MSANYPPDGHLLTDAIEQCDAESYYQQWEFLKVGTFTMLKNVGASDESTDWCLGVVLQEVGGLGSADAWLWANRGVGVGGFRQRESEIVGGKLGLVSCGDPSSQWYTTGGQFIPSHCYALGYSSILSVDEGCNNLFVSMATPDDAITRAQTFLAVDKKFIESIPPSAPTDAPTDGTVGLISPLALGEMEFTEAESNMNDLVSENQEVPIGEENFNL